MKYSLVIRQRAVVDAGLVGKVKTDDLCLLDYLRGWYDFDRAETEVVDGHKYVWLHAERAIEELPVLFNPDARLATRRNQLSLKISKLRKVGPLETKIFGRRLFFHLTDLGLKLTNQIKVTGSKATKSTASVTPSHDETVTPGEDNTVTSIRDEYLPCIIDETGTKESGKKESPPISPSEGDGESILSFWNSFSELLPAQVIAPNITRQARKLLADPWWREHWREGIQKAAVTPFLTGKGTQGWRASLHWFLKGDSLVKILEGHYDNRSQQNRELSVSDLKAQLKAIDEILPEHPANYGSFAYTGHTTPEEREEFEKLSQRREHLVRQLAGVP